MIDYFALLEQPRRPWLDLEQLREVFHQKTLQAHPDAQAQHGAFNQSAFTDINEAYQVLQDPKRRIQHLLTLEGSPPNAYADAIPKQVEELFEGVALLTQESEAMLQRALAATNVLSRSLVKSDVLDVETRLTRMLVTLVQLQAEADVELRQVSDSGRDTAEFLPTLHELYRRYSYVTRWIAQLREKQTQLASL